MAGEGRITSDGAAGHVVLGQSLLHNVEQVSAGTRWHALDHEMIGIALLVRLRDIGVSEAQLRPFAEKAITIRRILRVNPRMPSLEEVETILRAAW